MLTRRWFDRKLIHNTMIRKIRQSTMSRLGKTQICSTITACYNYPKMWIHKRVSTPKRESTMQWLPKNMNPQYDDHPKKNVNPQYDNYPKMWIHNRITTPKTWIHNTMTTQKTWIHNTITTQKYESTIR